MGDRDAAFCVIAMRRFVRSRWAETRKERLRIVVGGEPQRGRARRRRRATRPEDHVPQNQVRAVVRVRACRAPSPWISIRSRFSAALPPRCRRHAFTPSATPVCSRPGCNQHFCSAVPPTGPSGRGRRWSHVSPARRGVLDSIRGVTQSRMRGSALSPSTTAAPRRAAARSLARSAGRVRPCRGDQRFEANTWVRARGSDPSASRGARG